MRSALLWNQKATSKRFLALEEVLVTLEERRLMCSRCSQDRHNWPETRTLAWTIQSNLKQAATSSTASAELNLIWIGKEIFLTPKEKERKQNIWLRWAASFVWEYNHEERKQWRKNLKSRKSMHTLEREEEVLRTCTCYNERKARKERQKEKYRRFRK